MEGGHIRSSSSRQSQLVLSSIIQVRLQYAVYVYIMHMRTVTAAGAIFLGVGAGLMPRQAHESAYQQSTYVTRVAKRLTDGYVPYLP